MKEIIIQENGNFKAKIALPECDLKGLAAVVRAFSEKEYRDVVIVPNKLINFILK